MQEAETIEIASSGLTGPEMVIIMSPIFLMGFYGLIKGHFWLKGYDAGIEAQKWMDAKRKDSKVKEDIVFVSKADRLGAVE